MTFKTTQRLSLLISILLFLVVQSGFVQPEDIQPDVLELRRGGYVYADYPGVFDVGDDGITVELWTYFTDRPKDGDYFPGLATEGHWIIFAKPGSYSVGINGTDLHPPPNPREPEGTTHIRFTIEHRGNYATTQKSNGNIIPPGEFPLRRWIHIAFQIVAKGEGAEFIKWFDGRGGRRSLARLMGRTEEPLLIGGPAIVRFAYESMKGYIDEFRVSRGWHYPKAEDNNLVFIHPKRRFEADAQTIALWHFEEGPFSPRYADSSGNNYTLVPGGSLSVESHGKLATIWGCLKRHAQ